MDRSAVEEEPGALCLQYLGPVEKTVGFGDQVAKVDFLLTVVQQGVGVNHCRSVSCDQGCAVGGYFAGVVVEDFARWDCGDQLSVRCSQRSEGHWLLLVGEGICGNRTMLPGVR